MIAQKGTPLITSNGQAIISADSPLEKTGFSIGPPQINRMQLKAQRSIRDLPTEPKTQTAICVVLMYTLLGLTENEISIMTGVEMTDVREIKALPAYQETFEMIHGELINTNSSSIQAKIAALVPAALENLVEVMEDKDEHGMARVKAADSIMDRAGLSADTLYGKHQKDDGFDSLKIVVENGNSDSKINIDINRRS